MTNIDMKRTMQEAMRLMRSGDLGGATAAIQRHLGHGSPAASFRPASAGGTDHAVIEGIWRRVGEDGGLGPASPASRAPRDHDGDPDRDGAFTAHRFTSRAGTLDYKLFVPAGMPLAGAPLVVMLHGCTQSPDDFARGTRMNAIARQHGYVVAYPEQSQGRNASRCWNWFRSHDQQRGQGEPGLLAALTRDLVERHGLDAQRVYAAGLSAGGAMAVVLGGTYPDVYAAIGVHSGLPVGVAHDLPSAFAAMKQGGRGRRAASPSTMEPVPAIVFHGDQDTTVDAGNGAAVIAQCTGTQAAQRALHTTVEHGAVPNGREYTRTSFRQVDGSLVGEQWVVHGAGHAWSGGSAEGSYTDPSGPDASTQMIRFFSVVRDRVN